MIGRLLVAAAAVLLVPATAGAQISPGDAIGLAERMLGGAFRNERVRVIDEPPPPRRDRREKRPAANPRPATRTAAPVVAVPRSKPDRHMAALQAALEQLGYDPGGVDGRWGANSAAALARFQRDYDLPPTGEVSARTREALLAAAGGATVASAPRVPSGGSILGEWSGHYVCGQGPTGLTLTLSGDAAQARATFRFYPLPGDDAPSGEYRMTGTVDYDAGRISLQPTEWIDDSSGYSMVGLSARFDLAAGSITGKIDDRSCGELELTRSGAPAAEPAVVADAAPTEPAPPPRQLQQAAAADDFALPSLDRPDEAAAATARREAFVEQVRAKLGPGTLWRGTLACRYQPLAITLRQVDFTATERLAEYADPGRVAIELTTFRMANLNGEGERAYFVGGESADDGTMHFDRVSSDGLEAVREVALGFDKPLPYGKVTSYECDKLHVEAAADPLELSDQLGVTAAVPGGTFFASRDPAARCQAVLDWIARGAKDFPADGTRPGRHAQHFYIDAEFVPVFGDAYDRIDHASVRRAVFNVVLECERSAAKFKAARAARDTIAFSMLTNEPEAYNYYVNEVRLTRAAVLRLLTVRAAARKNPTLDTLAQFAAAVGRFEGGSFAMLPSRKTGTVAAFRQEISTLAAPLVQAELAGMAQNTEPEQLAAAAALLAPSHPTLALLDDAARGVVVATLHQHERNAADALFRPLQQDAAAAPATLEGILALDRLGAEGVLQGFSERIRPDYARRWAELRARAMDAAVDAEVAALSGLPATAAGLRAGADGLRRFTAAWQPLAAEPPVERAVLELRSARSRQLHAALPAFRADLARNPDAERDYLTLPEDRKSPVSLEYRLAAAGVD